MNYDDEMYRLGACSSLLAVFARNRLDVVRGATDWPTVWLSGVLLLLLFVVVVVVGEPLHWIRIRRSNR